MTTTLLTPTLTLQRANGGRVAGLLAEHVGSPVTVRFSARIPVAEAFRSSGPSALPIPPTWAEAASAGPIKGGVATVWTAHPSMGGDDGRVTLPALWAALEAPGRVAALRTGETGVLDTLRACVEHQPAPGEPMLVVARPLGEARATAALFRRDGALVAAVESTWTVR